ncbi:glycosyl transferase [Paludisphaera borealis]|uniref:Glycosyl transferase n=1 Tax=Paludisphaera borealis TaxID=1387353 RepID=A0A1U7CMU6_9BACT|nr:glycosyl transferase [Paludisphaera borealis]APW60260.1 putative glycosyltransferase of unknown function [Paludisphaera borealis]
MHVFTSITANYLPKAAALAHSVKRVQPEAVFHVVLSDDMPACSPHITEAFDSIINIRDLPIDELPRFIFRHRLVELCTAVKGTAFQYIADRFGADRIYYFDPDIIVAGRLDGLERALDSGSVLLTPHSIEPETDPIAVLDNEHCCLRHGVYNLGFLAVRMSANGRKFVDWWADRLRNYCYDEVENGLFTDQRWVDLAPALFDDITILREPQYNVSTWNLTHRRATGEVPYGIEINGRPLCFYHFSGFDSGAQLTMLDRYGSHSPVLYEFRDWYIAQCEHFGQSTIGKIPCIYGRYASGLKISDAHRKAYRRRDDLMRYFTNPFDDVEPVQSYRHWYQTHVEGAPPVAESVPAAVESAAQNGDGLRKLFREHAPEPVLRVARSAKSALRRLSGPA